MGQQQPVVWRMFVFVFASACCACCACCACACACASHDTGGTLYIINHQVQSVTFAFLTESRTAWR